jgi:hypothetical protein
MRKAAHEHFFTVRGQGFIGRQWDEIVDLAREIVERGEEAGIKSTFEADARRLVVTPSGGGRPLEVWCKGEPGIPRSIKTEGRFDLVVQSVLTAIKKVAPDLFVVSADDGRDYRRVMAKGEEGTWSKIKRLDLTPRTKEEAFLKAMSKQKWRHPDTANMVEFVSLPKREQTTLKHRWEQEFGDQYERALGKARREVSEAEKALKKVHEEKQQAEKAKGMKPKKKATMNDDIIRRAAIRVAHTTQDQGLKRQLLEILRDTTQQRTAAGDEAKEKEGRFEEGKDVDVGTWLKEHGYDEAAKKWEKHEGEIGKKSSVGVLFPEIRELAWKTTIAFAHKHPGSKTASGSTSSRVIAADRLAEKLVRGAIGRRASVLASLRPWGENKLPAALEAARGAGDLNTLATLLFVKRLAGIPRKRAADDAWLNEESFTKAATEVWGSEHLAKKWIQEAIKRPGRVRAYLGIPTGEDIPMPKLNEAIEKVKKTGNKSLLSALLLAKRLKGGVGKEATAA